MAKSVMDYIFRWLALRFLQKEERHNVGLIADMEPEADPEPIVRPVSANSNGVKNGNGVHAANGHAQLSQSSTATITDREKETFSMQSDAPPCPECGALTIRSGACYKCLSCGTSLGCS